MGWDVKVDSGKCDGDGACIDVCPVDVYELKGGKSVVINADECVGCESCIEACETKALTVTET